MGNLLIKLIPDSILPPGHLYEKQEGKRELLQRGDILPAGPPVYLRVVVILEVLFGLAAFTALAYLSLTQTTVDIKIGINLLPGWACSCLQPKNGNPNPSYPCNKLIIEILFIFLLNFGTQFNNDAYPNSCSIS